MKCRPEYIRCGLDSRLTGFLVQTGTSRCKQPSKDVQHKRFLAGVGLYSTQLRRCGFDLHAAPCVHCKAEKWRAPVLTPVHLDVFHDKVQQTSPQVVR